MDRDDLVAEIIELATAWQAGCATEDERARLERLLEDRAEAREVYLRVADDTVTLNDVRSLRPGSVQSPAAPEMATLGDRNPRAEGRRISRRAASRTLIAAAATLALVSAWGIGLLMPHESPQQDISKTFARIVSLSNVQWASAETPYREWARLGAGQVLKLDSGSVEILYDNGVQFVIQGPANCRFSSEHQVFATSGKLVARVGPEAIGFEILTPHAKVVDRGTSFGMTIDPDHQTDVVVYEGIVDLTLPKTPAVAMRSLEAGEAMRVGNDGNVARISTVAGDDFLPPPRLNEQQSSAGRVIGSVSDNLKSSDTSKYYRVMTRGFREDCQAYVDRMHQWNGLDEHGIPPFLDRGDYVMTFNDDKVQHDLRIAVTLDRPARLYLLIDDRAERPDWLTASFKDTGWDIGIDEGYTDVENVTTSIGAGRSIEWTFSVWSMDVPEPTTVPLGSLQLEETESPPREVLKAMYGIVATPLGGDLAPPRRK